MSTLKGIAAIVLWRTGQFDTADIAHALDVNEADVCRAIHAARDAERVPTLYLVEDAAL